MAMTRKDFEAIAAALKESRPTRENKPVTISKQEWEGRYQQWKHDVRVIVGTFIKSNPQFNEQRFFDAVTYLPGHLY